MHGEVTVEEILESSEKGERYLFDSLEVRGEEGLITYLREDLKDEHVEKKDRYWVWKRNREIDNRIGVPENDGYAPPEDYDWPIIAPAMWDRPYSIHEEKTDPVGVVAYPQYFVARRKKGVSGIKNGEYAALIDRHLKYIAINEDVQDNTALMRSLDRFGFLWEKNTTYGGELYNPTGENISLDYVKFLE